MSKELEVKVEKGKKLAGLLKSYEANFDNLLAKSIDTKKFLEIAIRQAKEVLFDCDARSVIISAIDCAALGLNPEKNLGQAYFIPRWNSKKKFMECTLMVGYKGFITLATRAGASSISAEAIYANDYFDFEYGTNPFLKHKPTMSKRGELVGAYAVCNLPNNEKKFIVLPKDDIDKRRNSSQSYQSDLANKTEKSLWLTDYPSMAIKSAIRKLSNQLDLSPNLRLAAAIDSEEESTEKFVDREYLPDSLPPETEIHEAETDQPQQEPDSIKALKKDLESCGKDPVKITKVSRDWDAAKKNLTNDIFEQGISLIMAAKE